MNRWNLIIILILLTSLTVYAGDSGTAWVDPSSSTVTSSEIAQIKVWFNSPQKVGAAGVILTYNKDVLTVTKKDIKLTKGLSFAGAVTAGEGTVKFGVMNNNFGQDINEINKDKLLATVSFKGIKADKTQLTLKTKIKGVTTDKNGRISVSEDTSLKSCYTAEPSTKGIGICKAGSLSNSVCTGEVTPTTEICDGKDDDCDGTVDEGLSSCCSGATKSLQTDEQNCGKCGQVCSSTQVCDSGVCSAKASAQDVKINGVVAKIKTILVNKDKKWRYKINKSCR